MGAPGSPVSKRVPHGSRCPTSRSSTADRVAYEPRDNPPERLIDKREVGHECLPEGTPAVDSCGGSRPSVLTGVCRLSIQPFDGISREPPFGVSRPLTSMSVTLPRTENEAVATPTEVIETQRVWGCNGPRGAVKVVRNHPGPSPTTVGIDPAGAVARGVPCRTQSAVAKAWRNDVSPPSLTVYIIASLNHSFFGHTHQFSTPLLKLYKSSTPAGLQIIVMR